MPKAKGDVGQKIATKLKCKACAKFRAKVANRKNFSDRWKAVTESARTSNTTDHDHSDQHAHAMLLLKKEHAAAKGFIAASYTPIAQMLQGLGEDQKAILRKKINIAFLVATKNSRHPYAIRYMYFCVFLVQYIGGARHFFATCVCALFLSS